MLGLYIHIPFCVEKCFYCDFNSYKIQNKNEKKEYIKNLKKEINLYKEEFKDKYFDTIFLGGGTPSILEGEELEEIFNDIYKNFSILKDAEITIECNPGTLTKKKLQTMKKCGVNRLSIGLQTTQNKNLKYIGRIHTYEIFEKNYKEALEVGFENINIDLMYSLPNQSFDEYKESLDKVIKLSPTHISSYSLILEENTKLHKMYENKEFELNSDELDIKIYDYTIDKLKENGYNHYEISNYSKNNYECKHNIIYWKCENYLGLGAGASGYINNIRYKNVDSINDYNSLLKNNQKPIEEINKLTSKDKIEEAIIMNLRMTEGIDILEFNKKYDISFKEKYNNILEKLKYENLIIEKNNRVFFTRRGRQISNTVLIEFLE